ncbi:hypothetical protein F53441_14567 [Fusarium austroafricanum]|uniref:Uncharacterized protein n=1 Tax=Fusarium austroafricanum TaxID=2364996 RepID=A0A8H4NBC6_9HYPO|nr:hypothetical protein F53441_14567 [Fusarium austroafricanum]
MRTKLASRSILMTIRPVPGLIYSRSDFATIAGPKGGNQFGHSSGITITDADGKELWNDKSPGGATSCANPNMELKVKSSCWDGEYIFNCGCDVFARMQGCNVQTSGGRSFKGEVDSSTQFIGIAISQTNICGASFPVRDECKEGATFEVVSHNPKMSVIVRLHGTSERQAMEGMPGCYVK